MQSTTKTRLRSALAALTGLAGAGLFETQIQSGARAVAHLPTAGAVVAAVAAMLPYLPAQLLARGLWWSNTALGVLVCATSRGHDVFIALSLLLPFAAALLLADRRALHAAAERAQFRPAAYGGTIQLLLVLALADTQTLALFGVAGLEREQPVAIPLLVLAATFFVGFLDLLRLSYRGVFFTMTAAALLALGVGTKTLPVDRELAIPMLVLAGLQLAVPVPMLLSMLSKRPLPSLPARYRDEAASGFLVLLTLVAAGYALARR